MVLVARLFVFSSLILFFLTGCAGQSGQAGSGPGAGDDPALVRLRLKWKHQFQFAGYYAAKEQGYYREAGMEVDIQEIGDIEDGDAIQAVIRGDAEFGVAASELLTAYAQGAPVVALAVIFQHSPLRLMALATPELTGVRDLAGQTVMLEHDSAELLAYLERSGVDSGAMTFLPHIYDPGPLLSGQVAAMSAFVTDEPYLLDWLGVDYALFSPRDAGIDFYGDTLFTSRTLARKEPELAEKFTAASLRGWEYAMDHQAEIVELILTKYSTRHSREHLAYEARAMEPLLELGNRPLGAMDPARWRAIADVYVALGMIPGCDLAGFLPDSAIEDLPGKEGKQRPAPPSAIYPVLP